MNQALEGIVVLDFTQLLQGPYATQMFGDLGADVLKVERTGGGDIYRDMTFFNQWLPGHQSPCFLAWNRNKRSVALDLKNPEAQKIIHELVVKADVVVENFRPGVMEKLNLGWGPTGPYADRRGQDLSTIPRFVSTAAMRFLTLFRPSTPTRPPRNG